MSSFYYDLTVTDPDVAYNGLIEDAKTIPMNTQRPLFILLEQINEFDEEEAPKISAIEFNKENLDLLFDIIKNPASGWNLYNNSGSNIGSDVVSRISTAKNKRDEYPEIWVTKRIALYNSDKDEQFKAVLDDTVFKEFLDSIPSFQESQWHNNGVFNAKFSPRYQFHDELPFYFRQYWEPIRDSPAKRKDLCYNKQFIDVSLSTEEKHEIGRIPCAIYALKQCGVADAVIRTIYERHICYGNTVKTHDLAQVLNSFKYRLKLYKISISQKVTITNNEYPRKTKDNLIWPLIELDFFRGHLMKHEEIVFEYENNRKEKKNTIVPFLRLLYLAFEEKLLVPMDSYEFASLFEDRGFALNYKVNTKEILDSCETGSIFDNDVVPFKGKNKMVPIRKIYADFECSTDEKYHVPYCISFTEINSNHKIKHFWGKDCAKQFLDYLVKKLNEDRINEKDHIISRDRTYNLYWKRPMCVVYFHNLRYDFTFLIKHLEKVKIVTKGNRLYSAKGKYGKGWGKMCLEFRDTLPLLQMSLRNAGKAFLPEKKQKKIKKEAFPYELYTYSFFDSHPSEWCTLEEFRAGFNNEQLLADFDENLPSLSSKIYNPENQHIFYKEYAHFYCDQDVRVLAQVMKEYDKLMASEGIKGINGVPPFGNKYSPFKYLTISSLAYDYNLKSCVVEWKQDQDENGNPLVSKNGFPIMKWLPRHEFYQVKGLLRYIGHQTIRGGRVMTRDNIKWHYEADPNNPDSILVDYDGVSLYPSAISRLWMTEGKPIMIKGSFSEKDFLAKFTHPDAPEGEFKDYNDGWVHVYSLMCWKDRHFPQLCIKDPKTKLNDYQNFHGAVDTWVNAIDLFNLIEFQKATFCWDAAVVWTGKRFYECRDMIKGLFEFRAKNKQHPIQLTTKLMMNSIYGKSALKPTNHTTFIVDTHLYRKSEDEMKKWEIVDNWREFFNANAYRIKEIVYLDKNHIEVKCHELDASANFVPFGSNVLAMARRIIGRVMALAEDMEELHPECTPGLFYTDTDSMHIRKDLLKFTEEAYMEKYGEPICGKNLCQFHIDFDPPRNFKKGEEVIGANESWFIMKKMYADQLIGTEGSIAYHQRMKGVPSDLVKWTDYEKIYNDQFVEFDLLEKGHVSFFYENGQVGSRSKMTRLIATKEAKTQLKEDLNTVNNFVEALEQLDRERTPDLEPEPQVLEPTPYQPPEWQEWMEGDTPKLDWETREIQEELATQKRQRDEIDIETEDEDLEIPEEKRLKCYEGIEDPEDANMILFIENGHPPTHWERRVFDEGWDPEADEDMISWWKALGKEQREWLLKLRGDK